MIACPSCGAALREDSRFCDKCGTMLPTSEKSAQYYTYPVPLPADLQLIQEVLTLLTPYWNQLDWNTIRSVVSALGDLVALGGAALAARRYLREWVRALKQQRPPPARRLEE
jgi:predicted nucleic acid-binding Zn ribbon protein